jgi:4'-phosphopantetheinyl transferase
MARRSAVPVVDVFRASPADAGSWADALTEPELDEIEQLRRPEDRARATTARAVLRLVVAGRLDCAPSDVTLVRRCTMCGGEHGKPTPRFRDSAAPVHTSVSYSGSVVLVAVAAVPIGIDVERCAATDFDGFAATALSTVERADLRAVAAGRQAGVRTALWAAKEAILKINGLGLSVAPADLHVGRNGRPGVVSVDPAIAEARVVAVAAVPVDRGYCARVACEGAQIPVVVTREASLLLEDQAPVGRTTRA